MNTPDANSRMQSPVHPTIRSIYSTREDVVDELDKRWANTGLAREILAFLEGSIPPPLTPCPRAVLSRNVATPDNELEAFTALSQTLGLSPLLVEFPGDRFTTNNRGKMALARMTFYHGIERSGHARITHLRVVDNLAECENQSFTTIRTRWGEPLVDFHHRLLRQRFSTEVYDASAWLRQLGKRAHRFYPQYLAAVAIRHVLFENIEPGKEEGFFYEVMLPALEFVHAQFGLKPLILPVAPVEEMHDYFWWSYPGQLKPLITELL